MPSSDKSYLDFVVPPYVKYKSGFLKNETTNNNDDVVDAEFEEK